MIWPFRMIDAGPDITLTWDEVWQGAQEGTRRWLKGRMLQRPTGNGRWDATQSTIEFDWTGALAERAFAKKLGEPWAPLPHPDRYHAPHDVAGWEVQGTRVPPDKKPHLSRPLTADPTARYVLLSGWNSIADLTNWTIVGWGIGTRLFEPRFIAPSPRGGPDVYWIPAAALDSWPPLLRAYA